MGELVTVARVGEIGEGEGKVVEANERAFALFRLGGEFYAIDNTCLHAGGPLGEGALEGDVVVCPWHAWRYNVKTGANLLMDGPGVKSYRVTVEGDEIKLEIE